MCNQNNHTMRGVFCGSRISIPDVEIWDPNRGSAGNFLCSFDVFGPFHSWVSQKSVHLNTSSSPTQTEQRVQLFLFKEPRIMGLVISLFGCGVSVDLPECLNEASGFTMKLYPPCVSNSRWLKLRPAIWLTLFSSLIDKKSFKPLNTHGYITSHCS